jgi:hypothetical protein
MLTPSSFLVNTELASGDDDEFGQVKDGYIQIRGQLVEIDYHYLPDQVNEMKPYHKVSLKGHEITMRVVKDDNSNEMASLVNPPHLYALTLFASTNWPEYASDVLPDVEAGTLVAIILAKVDENCFRRVGVAAGYEPQPDAQAEGFENPFLSLSSIDSRLRTRLLGSMYLRDEKAASSIIG